VRSKIPITIRKAGAGFKPLSGDELVKKVTDRAIGRFLSEVLKTSYSDYNPAEIEYQFVFSRGRNGDRAVKQARVRKCQQDPFIIISSDQLQVIGVTEGQFVNYLNSMSKKVRPVPGELFVKSVV
jgi:hypothetical protein